MIQSLYTAANAIDTYKNSLIITSGNIANINTPYYKSNTIQLQELKNGGVSVSSIRQNQQQSYTISSGRQLDFVIDGPGNFKLDDGGRDHFTRNGIFYQDEEGSIIDSEGRILLRDVFEPDESMRDAEIGEDGTFFVNGEVRGKVDVYNSYGERIPDSQYDLRTGEIEVSDVDYAREVINTIVQQNAFTANVASLRTNDEMIGLIVDLVS